MSRFEGPILWVVAEDQDDDVLILQRCCKRLSAPPQLLLARNGAEAMTLLNGLGSASVPSLILSDLKMPNVDGLELLAWVKGQSRFREIPFVLLTSSNDERDRSRAKELGADDYLVKPTGLEELVKVLRGVLKRWCLDP